MKYVRSVLPNVLQTRCRHINERDICNILKFSEYFILCFIYRANPRSLHRIARFIIVFSFSNYERFLLIMVKTAFIDLKCIIFVL
jgi:hypothetical protein